MAGVVIDDIKKHIDNGNNFLLSGGAGSGKTYTLMQVLDLIHEKNPVANIACITYTNVAVDEIKSRSPYENLRVSTIHDFLWDVIKSYQPNIKKSLAYLITLYSTDNKAGIKYDGEQTLDIAYVHPVKEHAWGQRAVRFYDPDRHILEVGENMKTVCRRFLDSGLTPEQTAARMDVPLKFVLGCKR